jgi:hypothetical protein
MGMCGNAQDSEEWRKKERAMGKKLLGKEELQEPRDWLRYCRGNSGEPVSHTVLQ